MLPKEEDALDVQPTNNVKFSTALPQLNPFALLLELPPELAPLAPVTLEEPPLPAVDPTSLTVTLEEVASNVLLTPIVEPPMEVKSHLNLTVLSPPEFAPNFAQLTLTALLDKIVTLVVFALPAHLTPTAEPVRMLVKLKTNKFATLPLVAAQNALPISIVPPEDSERIVKRMVSA